jgi:CDP-diacylglycerol---serine O-phosphatidyltransferase
MIRKNIPNFITCLNVASGSLAVLFAVKGDLTLAVILIFAAALFDFLDGMAARLLHAYSAIGKELDSLADMISFGLAPGMIMMVMQEYAFFGNPMSAQNFSTLSLWEMTCIFSSLLIPVASALRLAKFNVDARQSDSFIGLPTPANAIFIAALALIMTTKAPGTFSTSIFHPVVLLIITLAMSFLLVSEIKMFSLKFTNLTWKENKIRFIFLAISALLVITLTSYGIAASIILFILISIIEEIKK